MSSQSTGTATKYGLSRRMRWANAGNPYLTDAAEQKWDTRTPADSVAPETAFEQAVDVSVLALNLRSHRYGEPDALYYYYDRTDDPAWDDDKYGALFVVADEVVKSVFPLAFVDHGPTRAYLGAYHPAFLNGGDVADRMDGDLVRNGGRGCHGGERGV